MFEVVKKFSSVLIGATSLLAVLLVSGCGKTKLSDDKVVSISAPEPTNSREAFLSLSEFYDVYGQSDGLSADEIENLANKFKHQIETFLGVTDISLEELRDSLVLLLPSSFDGISPTAALQHLRDKLPLTGLALSKEELSQSELEAGLQKIYPGSTFIARKGLADALMMLDSDWASGDSDGAINRKELALPLLILNAVSDRYKDLNQISLGYNGVAIADILSRQQIRSRIEAQLTGRYEFDTDQKNRLSLSEDDQRLEMFQFLIRYYLVETYLKTQGFEMKIPISELAVSKILGHQPSASFITIYDQQTYGGNEDHELDSKELFFAISDQVLFENIHLKNHEDLISRSNITAVFPQLQIDDLNLPIFFGEFLDRRETLKRIPLLHTVNSLFVVYDADQDGLLSKQEMKPLFDRIGVTSQTEESAFFENIGLDSSNVAQKLYSAVRLKLRGNIKQKLSPREFYVRLMKVLPNQHNHN
ncbi:MAG: hypothetical protein AB7F43_14070 [Bacteriovoracia bacterium]